MSDYHEPTDELSEQTRDYTRAIKSLMEEFEAVEWYQQRIDAATDDAIRKILAHNRDEEMEHACMLLEWLRRNMDGWDENLRTYLFTEGDITELESKMEGNEDDSANSDSGDLGIRNLD